MMCKAGQDATHCAADGDDIPVVKKRRASSAPPPSAKKQKSATSLTSGILFSPILEEDLAEKKREHSATAQPLFEEAVIEQYPQLRDQLTSSPLETLIDHYTGSPKAVELQQDGGKVI